MKAYSYIIPGRFGQLVRARMEGCDCDEILSLISVGKINTTPLITHRIPLNCKLRNFSKAESLNLLL